MSGIKKVSKGRWTVYALRSRFCVVEEQKGEPEKGKIKEEKRRNWAGGGWKREEEKMVLTRNSLAEQQYLGTCVN